MPILPWVCRLSGHLTRESDQLPASCGECNNDQAYFYQLQIRSADEPMTTCACSSFSCFSPRSLLTSIIHPFSLSVRHTPSAPLTNLNLHSLSHADVQPVRIDGGKTDDPRCLPPYVSAVRRMHLCIYPTFLMFRWFTGSTGQTISQQSTCGCIDGTSVIYFGVYGCIIMSMFPHKLGSSVGRPFEGSRIWR